MKNKRRIRYLRTAVAVAVLAIAATWYAPHRLDPPVKPISPHGIVSVDTGGKLGAPTRQELDALSAELTGLIQRSSAGLTVVEEPDGMKWVDLEGRFLTLSVATIQGDSTVAECRSSSSIGRSQP